MVKILGHREPYNGIGVIRMGWDGMGVLLRRINGIESHTLISPSTYDRSCVAQQFCIYH